MAQIRKLTQIVRHLTSGRVNILGNSSIGANLNIRKIFIAKRHVGTPATNPLKYLIIVQTDSAPSTNLTNAIKSFITGICLSVGIADPVAAGQVVVESTGSQRTNISTDTDGRRTTTDHKTTRTNRLTRELRTRKAMIR